MKQKVEVKEQTSGYKQNIARQRKKVGLSESSYITSMVLGVLLRITNKLTTCISIDCREFRMGSVLVLTEQVRKIREPGSMLRNVREVGTITKAEKERFGGQSK